MIEAVMLFCTFALCVTLMVVANELRGIGMLIWRATYDDDGYVKKELLK
jgi:hypothetical protein